MTYDNFKSALIEEIRKHFSPECTIKIDSVPKTNGVTFDTLLIRESNRSISPTIYLKDYYKKDETSIEDIPLIASVMVEFYYEFLPTEDPALSMIYDFEKIRDKITFRIFNKTCNKAMLENIPYNTFLDFVICYDINLSEKDLSLKDYSTTNIGSIRITNQFIKIWNVDPSVIHEHALKNTPILRPYRFDSLENFMDSKSETDFLEVPDILDSLYILTNKLGTWGASTLLYPDLLKKLGETLSDDFYIIPSSVHEVLILKATCNTNYENLSELIKTVNNECLSKEDILSDHPYYYDHTNDRLSM